MEDRPSVNKETADYVGFNLDKRAAVETDGSQKKVFVGGRLIEPEEQERVLEVLKGLKAYIKVKMANNFFGPAGKGEEEKKDHPIQKKTSNIDNEPNPLSSHQAQR